MLWWILCLTDLLHSACQMVLGWGKSRFEAKQLGRLDQVLNLGPLCNLLYPNCKLRKAFQIQILFQLPRHPVRGQIKAGIY